MSETRSNAEAQLAQTAGYTTRLDPSQAALVTDAAKMLGVSTARFMREAVVRRAADLHNASGVSGASLRHIAALIVQAIVDPPFRYVYRVKGESGTRETTLSGSDLHALRREIRDRTLQDILSCEVMAEENLDDIPEVEIMNVTSVTLDNQHAEQFWDALRTASTEMTRIVLEELETIRSGRSRRYTPKIYADDLLKGEAAIGDEGA